MSISFTYMSYESQNYDYYVSKLHTLKLLALALFCRKNAGHIFPRKINHF